MAGRIKNLVSNIKNAGVGTSRTQTSLVDLVAKAEQDVQKGAVGMPRYSRHARDAMIVSCGYWQSIGKDIHLFVNPDDVRWSIPRRGTTVKTAAGQTRNTWRNHFRGTYYDEFTLDITFQSGSIMPSAPYADIPLNTYYQIAEAASNPTVPYGLEDFYRFLELINVPSLMGAYENFHIINYHSRIFPNLTMYGYFPEQSPISWVDSSKDGNQVKWNASFQCYYTNPAIWNAKQLISAYKRFIQQRNTAEQVGEKEMKLYHAANKNKVAASKPKTLGTTGGVFDTDIDGLTK